jgi:hypothetical protein
LRISKRYEVFTVEIVLLLRFASKWIISRVHDPFALPVQGFDQAWYLNKTKGLELESESSSDNRVPYSVNSIITGRFTPTKR